MSAANDPPRLDRQLCFAVYETGHAFTRFYRAHLARIGLTYPQYLAMMALWEAGELGVSELGRRLALDSGTLTPLLKRLETQGLVARRRDTEDERRVLVAPTAAGTALAQEARGVSDAVMAALDGTDFSGIQAALADLRRKLRAAT